MADNPGTSSDEPGDIDIGAAREAFMKRIAGLRESGYAGEFNNKVVRVLVQEVQRLYEILESETRRIDNELTQAVTDRDGP